MSAIKFFKKHKLHLPVLIFAGIFVANLLVTNFVIKSGRSFAAAGDFVGIQLSEEGGDESWIAGPYGDPQFAPFSTGSSGSAVDNNAFDPNYARVWISSMTQWNLDFRIGVQTSDGPDHGPGCGEQSTATAYTPWASDGGGSSGWQSDSNVYDPNCARIFVQTRPMPEGKGLTDARIGVAVSNGSGCRYAAGPSTWTPWAKQGGGWSGWAFASPNDFDCILVGLDSKVVTYGSVIVKTEADGTNTPPPSKWILLDSVGGDVAQESDGSISEQYDTLPEGIYKLDPTSIPRIINYQGKTYVLDETFCPSGGLPGVCPGLSSTLGTPDSSCPTGSYSPHTACVQNACRVVDGCGPSDCSDCSSPRGDRQPPDRQVRAPLGVPVAYAIGINDDGAMHNVCQAGYCDSVDGVGADECQDSTTCPGYTPPVTGGPPPVPPLPKLTFTLHYKVQSGGSFWVELRATPSQGPSPLNSVLKAIPHGGTGDVTYTFWKHCNKPGTDIPTLTSQCGAPLATGTSDTANATYNGNPDQTFTPKVVASRTLNGSPAFADARTTVTITGTSNVPPVSCTPETPTVPRNVLIKFTGSGGTNTNYSWTSPAGTGTGPTYSTSFTNKGQKIINIKSGTASSTCSVTVIDPNDTRSLACVGPATAPRLQDVTFTATSTGLTGNHTWSGGGTPTGAGVTGPTFTTQFYWPGTKVVTTTRDGLVDSCTIQILDSATSTTHCTINVTSNAPTNWTIAGPVSQLVHSPTYPLLVPAGTHTSDDSGNLLPLGTYQITFKSSPNGWSDPSSLASSGNCSASNPVLNFNINYTNSPNNLTCTPPTQSVSTVGGGTQASFSATGGTGTYSWSAPGGMPVVGTGSTFSTSYISSGPRTVTLSDGATTTTCHVDAFGVPPPICSGPTTLAVNQNGTFFASGGSGAPYLWSTSAQGWGDAVPSWGQGTSFTTHFTAVGGGQKVVRVWSGSNYGTCLVTLTSGNTHKECINQSCATVSGSGIDRCGSSADCGGGNGTIHGVCDQAQRACVNRAGPANGPSCNADPNCIGTTDSHLQCQNNSCVIVSGPGANSDGCAEVGDSCVGGPVEPPDNGGGTCTFAANPKVISRGDNSQLAWSCSKASSCVIRDTATGSIITTGGGSGSISVSPLRTTPYSINCNNGLFTGSVTVRVLSIIEVPPR